MAEKRKTLRQTLADHGWVEIRNARGKRIWRTPAGHLFGYKLSMQWASALRANPDVRSAVEATR